MVRIRYMRIQTGAAQMVYVRSVASESRNFIVYDRRRDTPVHDLCRRLY